MKIIGIDPGLASTGIGMIYGKNSSTIKSFAYGSVITSKHDLLQDRLNYVFTTVKEFVESEKPDLIVLEDIFSLDKYPKAGILLGKVSGVILLVGSQLKVSVKEMTVREVKEILTKNGNSSKKQLEKVVRSRLNLMTPICSYHAADALGLAIAGLSRYS